MCITQGFRFGPAEIGGHGSRKEFSISVSVIEISHLMFVRQMVKIYDSRISNGRNQEGDPPDSEEKEEGHNIGHNIHLKIPCCMKFILLSQKPSMTLEIWQW